jgi:hypothetical protein
MGFFIFIFLSFPWKQQGRDGGYLFEEMSHRLAIPVT